MRFEDRPVAKLLTYWRENYGLAMSAHLLVHITGIPWPELREELRTRHGEGFYRMLQCPDIQAPVFYIDWPAPCYFDSLGAVYREVGLLDKVDEQIEVYPPSEGYIGVRNDEGHKAPWFRDVARDRKGTSYDNLLTPNQIMEDLRAAWQRVSAVTEK